MWKTNVKVAELPEIMRAIVHDTVPPEPGMGLTQLKSGPLFCISLTKVIPAGMLSFSETESELSGPRFVTVMLYGTSVSASATAGPLLVTPRSAD